MKASPAEVIRRLKEANIPRYASETTLVRENAQALRDTLVAKSYKSDVGMAGFHIAPATRKDAASARASRIAAVMAKELVLQGESVYFVTLAGFLREVRLQSYSTDYPPIHPVLTDMLGDGYLVISNFDDVTARPSQSVWLEGLDLLLTHSSRGAGLVLASETSEPLDVPPVFLRLVQSFHQIAA